MKKRKKIIPLLLLFAASFLRIIMEDTISVIYVISHMVILMIYLVLLVSWGISIYDRIVNKVIRRYLVVLVGMMVFWIFVRTLRHTVFLYVYPFGMWCWYAYYIPIILIPQLCLFAAKYIGEPEEYQLPPKWYFTYIPSIILIIGIFTNDLHQWAFYFHQGYEAGWDIYQHGFLYYIITVWTLVGIIMMITEFVRSCHIPRARKIVWTPIAVLGISLFYCILYGINSEVFGFIEITAGLCFTVIAIWESSIKAGLVQSNTHYEELLRYSGLGVMVVDNEYTVHYHSEAARILEKEQMKAAGEAPLMLDKGIRVSSSGIRGGYALWQEDMSELINILEELEELQGELKDSNAVSMQNYQLDKQIRALAEQNRLHDEFQKQTAHQINLLNDWLRKLIEIDHVKEKRELLRRIVVVGAYIKRRSNLILINEQDGIIKVRELDLSIKEIMKNLQLAGIHCACAVQFEKNLPAYAAMKLLDFYEYVLENAFDGLESLLVRFFRRGNSFYACIDAVCTLNLTVLRSDTIDVNISDENCYTLSLKVEGGVGK